MTAWDGIDAAELAGFVAGRIDEELDDKLRLAAAIAPGIAGAVRRFDDALADRMDIARGRLDDPDRHPVAVVASLAMLIARPGRPAPTGYATIPHTLPGLGYLADEQYRRAISPLLTPTPAGPRCCASSLAAGEANRGVVRGWGHDWYCLLPAGHIGDRIGGRHGFDAAAELAERADMVGLDLYDDDGALEQIDGVLSDSDAHDDPDGWRAAAACYGIDDDLLLPWARRFTRPGGHDRELAARAVVTRMPRSR